MAVSTDDLIAAIGSPPTATGIAAAIQMAVNPAPVTVIDPPDDHGLDASDPALTGVSRDETVPTPGVDLPPAGVDLPPAGVDLPPAASAPTADDHSTSGGSASVPLAPTPPADDPLADKVTADEAQLTTDEADVTADQLLLGEDEAAAAAAAAEAAEQPAT